VKQGRSRHQLTKTRSPILSWVIISVVVHAALFGLIAVNIDEPVVAAKPVVAVNSYLYTAPQPKKVEPKPLEIKSEEKTVIARKSSPEIEVNQQETNDEKSVLVELPKSSITAEPQTTATELEIIKNNTAPPLPTSEVLTSKQGKRTINTSAFRQLDKLRTAIDQQIVNDEVAQIGQHRSLSGMHPNPAPAPTSLIPLTKEQKKEKNTTRYSDSLSVIKGDDGRCSIEEDLSHVGIAGVKAYSGFNCGESKFDSNFRQHMQKVRKKIGK